MPHSSSAEQVFNDDLMLTDKDREQATKRFPTIMHVLDNPALRGFFEKYDDPAKSAKQWSRLYGMGALALGTLAIIGASTEVWIHAEHGPQWLVWLTAGGASLAGILSVWIASSGVLFGKAKSEWLHQRFMTETIRQFHFQGFLAHASDIARSLVDEGAKAVFLRNRTTSFEAFRNEYEGKPIAKWGEVRSSDTYDGWLHGPIQELDAASLPQLDVVLQAYRELRIKHQIDYANWRLREDHRLFSDAPNSQVDTIELVSLLCIGGLFFLHFVIIAGIAFLDPDAEKLLYVPFSILVIWIAAIALGVRVLEQGLQPGREVERYLAYRSSCRALLQRFDKGSRQEQLKLIPEMERLAYDEMRNFLLTNSRAKFVL